MANRDRQPAPRPNKGAPSLPGIELKGRIGIAAVGVVIIVACLFAPVHPAVQGAALVLGGALVIVGLIANRLEGQMKVGTLLEMNMARIVTEREHEIVSGDVVDIKNVWPDIDPVVPSDSIEPGESGGPTFSKVLPRNTRLELTKSAQGELQNFFPDDARAIVEGLLHLPAALETKDGVRLIEQPTSVDYYTYSPVKGVQVSFRQVAGTASDGKTTYVVLSVIPQSD
ncbi:hypothetical protein R4P47_24630 [Rhodococcus sp. IEGM 1370]|uniref:hypothetical protein n=1 Tax=Rhodococcus sp. IEGM 1370 TaxID=3082222 RepID=UPI002953B473|nr:hypothetical protein [Rhodococcus sp. IEGM 1370]MDV8079758.1 hypothetical protein [Rhodococcus sp. IEGM 1370]